LIEEKYGEWADEKEFALSAGDSEKTIALESLNAEVNPFETANKVRESMDGNWLAKVWEVAIRNTFGRNIPLVIDLDEAALRQEIEIFASSVDVSIGAFEVDLERSRLIVNTEVLGGMVDADKTFDKVIKNLSLADLDSSNIVLANASSSRAKAEYIRAKLPTEPVDASCYSEGGEVHILDSQAAVHFDMNRLQSEIAKGGIIEIPISFEQAELTKEKLQEVLFRDVLGEYSTTYKMDGSRSSNIATAGRRIHGKILLPGEQFSFNKVVGARTFASGFKIAHVYSNGQIIDGVGGGICQVSTTLYSAVLYADLQVDDRRNHQFTVGYVPFGQDATVSYGGQDFCFTNNTELPVKLEIFTPGNGRITVRILGTQNDPGKEIQLIHSTISVRGFATIEKVNPNPSVTRTITEQSVMTGYTVNSTKIIKRGGVEVERIFLHQSSYNPLNKIVLVPQNAPPTSNDEPSGEPGGEMPGGGDEPVVPPEVIEE